MDTTNTLDSTGRINAAGYIITFVASINDCWISLYEAERDYCWTREYSTAGETLETVTLLLTSNTMREEFCKWKNFLLMQRWRCWLLYCLVARFCFGCGATVSKTVL